MNVYLITVEDHQEGMGYHVCATEADADTLFQKIIKENYFDSEKDTRKDFWEACYRWFWKSQHRDTVTCLKCHVLTEEEV
jgi:hypothetical protein